LNSIKLISVSNIIRMNQLPNQSTETIKVQKTMLSQKYAFWLRTNEKQCTKDRRNYLQKEKYLNQIEKIAEFDTVHIIYQAKPNLD